MKEAVNPHPFTDSRFYEKSKLQKLDDDEWQRLKHPMVGMSPIVLLKG